MYSNSSASSADPEQIRRRVAAQGQRAVDDVLREKEEEESGAPGAPPKVHEGRRGAGLSEEGGMDIDNAEDTWSSRGQKRKREMSGDILARHSQPKLRRVEVSDEQGPPLSCKVAAADGDADPLRIVITGEFNIDTINEWECTALEIAALGGSAEAIGLLLKEGAQIGQVNNQGRTPLHMAAGNGQTETIGLLLKEGAQIGQVDNDGNTHCI